MCGGLPEGRDFKKKGNMGYGKWIGGIVGVVAQGPLGALGGVAIGSLVDTAAGSVEQGGERTAGERTAGGNMNDYEDAGYGGRRNSFLFSMLVMASYIIRADGRIMHSEMEFVRRFLRMNFGDAAVEEGQQILLNLFEQRKRMERTDTQSFRRTIHHCGRKIAAKRGYAERRQLRTFRVT